MITQRFESKIRCSGAPWSCTDYQTFVLGWHILAIASIFRYLAMKSDEGSHCRSFPLQIIPETTVNSAISRENDRQRDPGLLLRVRMTSNCTFLSWTGSNIRYLTFTWQIKCLADSNNCGSETIGPAHGSEKWSARSRDVVNQDIRTNRIERIIWLGIEVKNLLRDFSLGGRDKLREFALLVGRPKAFNPPLKLLNRWRRKTVALSNADFWSLKIERLSPLADSRANPGLSNSFPEIYFMISADKCESYLISPWTSA
jgi:hypothetical protein